MGQQPGRLRWNLEDGKKIISRPGWRIEGNVYLYQLKLYFRDHKISQQADIQVEDS